MTSGIKAGKSSCKKRESRNAKSAKRELTGRHRSPIGFVNYEEPELILGARIFHFVIRPDLRVTRLVRV